MNNEQWKLFIEAAELGSLTKVAFANNTSQPVITKKINELEKQCGGRLFHRTGRGVILTELGEVLLPKIKNWLDDTNSLQNDILSLSGQPVGNIRIGALPSTIRPLMIPLYEKLSDRYPMIHLKIREGQGAQLETWLEEGQLDLALLLRHRENDQAGDIYLSKIPTYLISAQQDPLTANPTVDFACIDNLPLTLFCRPNSWRNELDRLAQEEDIRLKIICEADSLDMQAEIVANGKAYALLGESAFETIKDRYAIRAAKIIHPEILHYLAIGMSKRGKLGIAEKIVIDTLRLLSQLSR